MLFNLMFKTRTKPAPAEVVPDELVVVAREEGINLPDWYVESAQVGVKPSIDGMFGVGKDKGVQSVRVQVLRSTKTAE